MGDALDVKDAVAAGHRGHLDSDCRWQVWVATRPPQVRGGTGIDDIPRPHAYVAAMRRRSSLVPVALITAVAWSAAGCSAETGATKAGGEAAPVTLRIGTDDPPGRATGDQIEEFARQVETLSDGLVRIEPVWKATGETGPDAFDDWDQKVARLVVDGELEMGLIPARAWDTEGVTELRPLNAPFLVTSGDLTARVVSGDIAERMLEGLDEAGVRGLALIPEGMRYVMSFTEPMVTLEDFDGALVRAPWSATTYATFVALGATPDDVTANDEAIEAGEVDAVETSFARAADFPGPAIAATGNLPLWPKVNSLVVNTEVFDGLSSTAQEALVAAAEATRDWTVEAMSDPVEDAAAYCGAGGTVVHAAPGDVAAMRRATDPVFDDLNADPTTRQIIEDIAELAASAGTVPAVVPLCDGTGEQGPAPETSGPLTAPGDPGDLPEGVYRYELTPDFLRDAGLPEEDVYLNAGANTVTLRDGQWTIEHRPLHDNADSTPCEGFYSVEGSSFTASTSTQIVGGTCAPPQWTATWSFVGDTLTWTDVSIADFAPVFAGNGWRKIS